LDERRHFSDTRQLNVKGNLRNTKEQNFLIDN
jgi:hypothetical protein